MVKKETNSIIENINENFGQHIINNLYEQKNNIEVFSTGSLQLDNILGCNGYPVGRIIEIYGGESSGKTTLALNAVAQQQKLGKGVVYIDLEHALSKSQCLINGVNIEKLIIIHPDSCEQTFALIEALIKTGEIGLIVVDSVAALIPQAELDGDFNDQTIGLTARLMSKGMRNIQPLMDKFKTTVIFINQLREKIGVMFGNNETTTGGRALRFYASIRMELRKSELIKKSDEIIGIKTSVKIVKNKLAPPLTKTTIDIYFDRGFDHIFELIDMLLTKGIFTKKGAWIYYGEEKLGCGREATKEFLLNNVEKIKEFKDLL